MATIEPRLIHLLNVNPFPEYQLPASNSLPPLQLVNYSSTPPAPTGDARHRPEPLEPDAALQALLAVGGGGGGDKPQPPSTTVLPSLHGVDDAVPVGKSTRNSEPAGGSTGHKTLAAKSSHSLLHILGVGDEESTEAPAAASVANGNDKKRGVGTHDSALAAVKDDGFVQLPQPLSKKQKTGDGPGGDATASNGPVATTTSSTTTTATALPLSLTHQQQQQQQQAMFPPIINGLFQPPPHAAVLPPIWPDEQPQSQQDDYSNGDLVGLMLARDLGSFWSDNARPSAPSAPPARDPFRLSSAGKEQLLGQPMTPPPRDDEDEDGEGEEVPEEQVDGRSFEWQTSAKKDDDSGKNEATKDGREGASPSALTQAAADKKSTKKTRQPRAEYKYQKWTQPETDDLLRGVAKHGVGRWADILRDPEYHFVGRTAVDLKDRFRTCCPDKLRPRPQGSSSWTAAKEKAKKQKKDGEKAASTAMSADKIASTAAMSTDKAPASTSTSSLNINELLLSEDEDADILGPTTQPRVRGIKPRARSTASASATSSGNASGSNGSRPKSSGGGASPRKVTRPPLKLTSLLVSDDDDDATGKTPSPGRKLPSPRRKQQSAPSSVAKDKDAGGPQEDVAGPEEDTTRQDKDIAGKDKDTARSQEDAATPASAVPSSADTTVQSTLPSSSQQQKKDDPVQPQTQAPAPRPPAKLPRAHRERITDSTLASLGIDTAAGPFTRVVPRRERRPFTPEDDAAILEGYAVHGPRWSQILRDPRFAKRLGEGRTARDLRDRLRNMKPELFSADGGNGGSSGSSNGKDAKQKDTGTAKVDEQQRHDGEKKMTKSLLLPPLPPSSPAATAADHMHLEPLEPLWPLGADMHDSSSASMLLLFGDPAGGAGGAGGMVSGLGAPFTSGSGSGAAGAVGTGAAGGEMDISRFLA